MKILSYNIKSLESSFNKNLLQFINFINADIICFSEIKLKKYKNINDYFNLLNNYNIYVNECKIKTGYSGTCILSKLKPINIYYGLHFSKNKNNDKEGRNITLEFDKYFLIFSYFPNSGDELKFKEKRIMWDKLYHAFINNILKKKDIIACGDFNVCRFLTDVFDGEKNINRTLTSGCTIYERFNFEVLLKINNLIDVWYYLHKNINPKQSYTYWTYHIKNSKEKGLGFRLDYFIVSKNLINKILSMKNLQNINISDHCPQILEINI